MPSTLRLLRDARLAIEPLRAGRLRVAQPCSGAS
jgi:hypothetical protein